MKRARTAVEIGKLIKFYRQKHNYTQKELAQKCRMTQVSISNIENGIGGTFKALEKILRILNLELSFHKVQKIDTDNIIDYLE